MNESRDSRVPLRPPVRSSLSGPTMTTVPPAVHTPDRATLMDLRQACTLLACIVLFHACGGDDSSTGPPPPDPPRPTTVAVSPGTAQLSALGATVQLRAEVRDQNGQAIAGAAVAWSSGSNTIATVDGSGLVTAVQNGTVTITATAGSASGSAAVTVAQVASAVAVTPATAELTALGATVQLSAEVLDQNGNALAGSAVAWSNADPSVATVDDAGLVTAVGNGMATVTATSGSASGSAAVTVAQMAREVTVTPTTVELMALGLTVQLSAEVLDANGNALAGATVAWSHADSSVATVNEVGVVTAVGNGMSTVTATSDSASGSAAVTVAQVASLVTVEPTADTLSPGDTLRLSARAEDANGHAIAGAEFSWTSSDIGVARVGNSGLVTAIGLGVATIMAKSGDASTVTEIMVAYPDRAALVALYHATDGPNWARSEGWLTDAPLGLWHGVDADDTGRVTRLALISNGLSGTLPPELGNLANLTGLHLAFNELSGPIPPELGNLASLTVLHLGTNELSGPIPPELGNLEDLTALLLWRNSLSGAIPSELGQLADLETLFLWSNNLSGPIPTSFLQLRRLEFFHWYDTDLCVPTDRTLRWWLRSIQSLRSTGVNCPSATDSLRLEFDSLAEVADWSRTSSTDLAVRNGILRVGTDQVGGYGFIWTDRFLESVVTDWEARVRLGRGEASGSAVFRVFMDHPRYTSYAFEFGSERQVAGVETNWRIWFYDQDFHGPGRGSWFVFTDYGYGTSRVIKDGAGEFMDVTIQSRGDSLRIHVDGTLLFGDLLPLRITGALAVDVRGLLLGYQSHTQSDLGHANFDWIELKGQVVSSADAGASVETMHRTIEDAVSTPTSSIRAVKVPP